jgi:hypothetical protein
MPPRFTWRCHSELDAESTLFPRLLLNCSTILRFGWPPAALRNPIPPTLSAAYLAPVSGRGCRREDGFFLTLVRESVSPQNREPSIYKILLTSSPFPPILLILTPLFCGFLIVSAGRRYKILNPILTADSTQDMFFPKRKNIENAFHLAPPSHTLGVIGMFSSQPVFVVEGFSNDFFDFEFACICV